MKDLTVLIIAKNEEDVIERCIKSCKKLTDTILVIDSGSEDSTINKSQKAGAKVIKHSFTDFSDQRNFAALQATSEWILYVDADEELTDGFCKEVISVVDNGASESIAAFYVKRENYFLGKKWGMQDKMPRLFVRDKLVEWKGTVHETPEIKGVFGEIDNPINHYTHRDISKMVEKTNSWSEYEAELRLKANHPQMSEVRFIRIMLTGFLKSYIKEKGYRNGTAGIIEAFFQAFSMFVTYAKLWEKQMRKK